MARFVLSGIGSIPGNTTKTVHMYGPVGWQIVSGGWQFTTDGSLSLQASHPALPGNRLKASAPMKLPGVMQTDQHLYQIL
jgi:hypothetical protein